MFRKPAHAPLIACLVALGAAAHAEPPTVEGQARLHLKGFPGFTLDDADHSYERRDTIQDADGQSHVRFNRRVKGLRVIGGDIVMHIDPRGQFRGTTHNLRFNPKADTAGRLNPAEARRAALAVHPGTSEGAPKKVIYARGAAPRLAYEVEVQGAKADGTPMEKHVIVDALTGGVLEAWDDIHTASAQGTGRSFFSGNVTLTTDLVSGRYYLRDPSRGNTYTTNMANKTSGSGTVFSDADNTWGDNTLANTQTIGVDAQYGTATTWDYYKAVHGRLGIANDGRGAYNKVHYNSKYNNAYWSDSCFCMTYGDGDGTTFNPFDSLDVAGHEMTHGVISRTANLTYSGESGGLNEATSDIFGTLVELYARNASDPGDYLIGEKLYKSGGGKALRYMNQPSKDGSSADCWYSTLGSLDVHYSSGVANHFFFLLAEGTGGNGFGASKTCQATDTKTATGTGTLTGIGRDVAGKIWYRALTVYMTSSTNYAGARSATLKAAADLYGAGSANVNAVAAAWKAVNVN
ncbi:MAG: M4 family metallopeptidase [Inhella sp.]|jgi:Zn-dependent metalloprotease|uniref:M4 family metallopeptidase n=1 Tax=Inhella sp. TaxID=1921806 RepID=UPI0022C24CCC|nr:M4 family metallopeptidase [Inhella sp.]MCZ8234580.1 M4 family metallopeptidase [Inhella sp.]